MGLKEKRIIQAFQKDLFPALEAEINTAAGYNVSLNISWDTLMEDRFSHLYNDTFPKIYFLPLIEAFKVICVDDMGKELLQAGLKEVGIVNENNEHNLERAITFEDGVLRIDHSPVMNADKVDDRTERIVGLLEEKLERFAEASPEGSNSESGNEQEKTEVKLTAPQLYNQSLMISMERQGIFKEMVNGLDWSCDMLEGKLTYGEDKVFNIQVIGTYSENEKSWLWGWANTQSGIPERFLQTSSKMKDLGEKNGVKDFIDPKLNLDVDPGHYFLTIASSMLKGNGYTSLKFNSLEVYVLIFSEELDSKAIEEPALICDHFSKMVANVKFSHKHSLFCYLIDKGYELELPGNNVIGKKGDDQILGIFDLKGNLMKITNSKIIVQA